MLRRLKLAEDDDENGDREDSNTPLRVKSGTIGFRPILSTAERTVGVAAALTGAINGSFK
jgi:hypothetical protein